MRKTYYVKRGAIGVQSAN